MTPSWRGSVVIAIERRVRIALHSGGGNQKRRAELAGQRPVAHSRPGSGIDFLRPSIFFSGPYFFLVVGGERKGAPFGTFSSFSSPYCSCSFFLLADTRGRAGAGATGTALLTIIDKAGKMKAE